MTTFEYINVGMNALLLLGIYLAYKQFVESKKANKAQVLLKFHEEWRSPQIYNSIVYIHKLRDKWKERPLKDWDDLAKEWVENTYDKNNEEWHTRRTASQFLGKMGYLVQTGYLTTNDFFGAIPEAGRLLIVLIPLEIAIENYMTKKQVVSVAEWDRPFGKWELNFLWDAYKVWYEKNGEKYETKPINWRQLM